MPSNSTTPKDETSSLSNGGATLAAVGRCRRMAPMDDLKDETPASDSTGAPKLPGPRSVGPESEARGGAEAPDESLNDDLPAASKRG